MNDIATSNIARAANMNGGGKPDFSRIRTVDGLDVKGSACSSASISTSPCRMAK